MTSCAEAVLAEGAHPTHRTPCRAVRRPTMMAFLLLMQGTHFYTVCVVFSFGGVLSLGLCGGYGSKLGGFTDVPSPLASGRRMQLLKNRWVLGFADLVFGCIWNIFYFTWILPFCTKRFVT